MQSTAHARHDAPVGLIPPDAATPAAPKRRRRLPVWAWVIIGVVLVGIGLLLSPVFAAISLVVLITGIVALAKRTPTWLRLRTPKIAAVVTAAAGVVFLVTGLISSAIFPSEPATDAAAHQLAASELSVVHAAPSKADAPATSVDGMASTAADETATAGTALATLATLEVKGRAPATGYARNQFGQRWLDVDRNGCDTRNDVLAAQLTDVVRRGSCRVLSGTLADPYTAKNISFVRGQGTSELVQIDHVVSLSDAWQTGAQKLSPDQRASFANDPLNLLAVDGPANAKKGDGDAATWLPANKAYRCEYVARQISVKATYGLWVTPAEHDAMARVLAACPDQPTLTSTFASPAPAPVQTQAEPAPAPAAPAPAAPAPPAPAAPAPVAPAPAPAQPAPAPAPAAPTATFYQNCDAVRAAGAAPIHVGDPGYSRKLDRDGDGTGCE
ncbi:DUF1524 domain-containing protein [Microbacterium sp. AZCO]|uniref:GmrSD restriction endonuclease domain-containing protein n=1 Tax=Microbacterium sp. AZCO TaxID=3142976 RepID=UPI0031F401CE